MAITLSPSQSDIQTALRMFLLTILPAGTEVFEGLDNLVPEPQTPGFVTMTVLRRLRLATNADDLNDTGDQMSITQSTDVVIQLDCHSNDLLTSSDNAQIISTLFRDDYATTFFEGYPGITPLFSDEPRLLPFVNAESQYEPRYTIEVHLQADQVVTTTAETATSISLDVTNVETDPDSWPNSTVTVP